MAKNRPKTPLQLEYQKQRRRIQQFVRRAEKRGYQFAENIIPDKPKRITKKSVERLNRLRPEQLYKKSIYGGEATGGEIVKGTAGRKAERRASALKAKQTREYNKYKDTYDYYDYEDYDYNDYYQYNDEGFTPDSSTSEDTTFYDRVIISNFKSVALEFKCRDMLINWVNSCIARMGEHATAQMIQTASDNGIALGISIKPSDKQDKVARFLSEMLSYMEEVGDFTRDDIMQAVEMEESYEPI